MSTSSNFDDATVSGFGDEWSTFDQSRLESQELDALFEQYFEVFPWAALPKNPTGFDLGCGSGRWATRVAPRVGTLHCVDASQKALEVAQRNLADHQNCAFHHASVDATGLPEASMDFGYSLGVLHHVPDTQAAITACARLLKPGAPLQLYLYYALDNRPGWYRALWRLSDTVRRGLSRTPHRIKLAASTVIATLVYLPLARGAGWVHRTNASFAHQMPLAYYAERSFYTMRTDAYDRFGTRLEQRFTRLEIDQMMREAGLERLRFSEGEPFWCVVGFRSAG